MTTLAPDMLAKVDWLRTQMEQERPATWRPKEDGAEIVGRFVRLERGVTTHGDAWIVVLESIRIPGRFAAVWLFHKMLLGEFDRTRPRPGDLVLIRYEGIKAPEGDGGHEYHTWRVATDRENFTWDEALAVLAGQPVPDPLSTLGSPGFWPEPEPTAGEGESLIEGFTS